VGWEVAGGLARPPNENARNHGVTIKLNMAKKVEIDPAEAIAKLRVTRHRLETALDRFYTHNLNDEDLALEAAVMDICVPIRVMVHHVPEKKTICVLHQVEKNYWTFPIRFAPLIADPPAIHAGGVRSVTVAVPVNMTMGPGGAKFTRYKRGDKPDTKARFLDWWIKPCWDSGTNKVSNRDIVLAMANKEGGAHVAGDIPAKFRVAKNQGHLALGDKKISDIGRLGGMMGIAGDELLEYLDNNFGKCFR